MTLVETAALGALAGFTIYLGLPLARLRLLSDRSRVALAMFAVGVLAFLFVDVMAHGEEILEHTVEEFGAGKAGVAEVVMFGALLAGGFAAGTAGLSLLERYARPAGPRTPPIAGGATAAVAAPDVHALHLQADAARRRALRMGLAVATAIGIHN